MSLHFDMVINCDLREDTPESFIEATKCLTQKNYLLDAKPELIYPNHGTFGTAFTTSTFLRLTLKMTSFLTLDGFIEKQYLRKIIARCIVTDFNTVEDGYMMIFGLRTTYPLFIG